MCEGNGDKVYGGFVTEDLILPVGKITLPQGSNGRIQVGDMSCFGEYYSLLILTVTDRLTSLSPLQTFLVQIHVTSVNISVTTAHAVSVEHWSSNMCSLDKK